jgi:hypothetical protein
VELPGVPGFHAEIAYAIEATLIKGKSNPITKALGLGNPTVSTPFIYRCRTRPAAPLPAPLSCSSATHGFRDDPRWTTTEAKITSRIDVAQDIAVKLHLPRSKIFSITEPIPFHADFVGSAISLATFMSFGPMPAGFGSPMTTIRVIRRSNCDIRNQEIDGTRTDMWRTEVIGSGAFERAGDGSDWMSLNGRLNVSDRITVGGFRAGGLFVKVKHTVLLLRSSATHVTFRTMSYCRWSLPSRTGLPSGNSASSYRFDLRLTLGSSLGRTTHLATSLFHQTPKTMLRPFHSSRAAGETGCMHIPFSCFISALYAFVSLQYKGEDRPTFCLLARDRLCQSRAIVDLRVEVGFPLVTYMLCIPSYPLLALLLHLSPLHCWCSYTRVSSSNRR